jgi:hypothetical protein
MMVMALAKDSFTVSAGGYTRTFPMANLRKAVEPVLHECAYALGMFGLSAGTPDQDCRSYGFTPGTDRTATHQRGAASQRGPIGLGSADSQPS